MKLAVLQNIFATHRWPSRVGQIRGLTEENETLFRLGRCVEPRESLGLKKEITYALGGPGMPGIPFSLNEPVGASDYQAYRKWAGLESYPANGVIQSARSVQQIGDLRSFLDKRKIAHDLTRPADYVGNLVCDYSVFSIPVDFSAAALAFLNALPVSWSASVNQILVNRSHPRVLEGIRVDSRLRAIELDVASLRGPRRLVLGLLAHCLGVLQAERARSFEDEYQVLAAQGALLEPDYYLPWVIRYHNTNNCPPFPQFCGEMTILYVYQPQILNGYIGGLTRTADKIAWHSLKEKMTNTLFEGRTYEPKSGGILSLLSPRRA